MAFIVCTAGGQSRWNGTIARRLGQDVLDLQAIDVAQAFLRGVAQVEQLVLHTAEHVAQAVQGVVVVVAQGQEALTELAQLVFQVRHERGFDDGGDLRLGFQAAQLGSPLHKQPLVVLGLYAQGVAVEEKAFNLLGKVVDGFCGAVVVQRQQQDQVLARLDLVHEPDAGDGGVIATIVHQFGGAHQIGIATRALFQLHGQLIGRLFVAQALLAFGGDDPFVNLVLAQDAVVVARHEEVAQEPQRAVSFAGALQVAREFFPLALDTVEIVAFGLFEKQVLDQIHRVEARAPLVDGFKDLQGTAEVFRLDDNEVNLGEEVVRILCQHPQARVQVLLQMLLDALVSGMHAFDGKGAAGRERLAQDQLQQEVFAFLVLQFQAHLHLLGLHVKAGQPGLDGLEVMLLDCIQRLTGQQIPQRAHGDDGGGEPLLAINHVMFTAVFDNDDGADEVAAGRFGVRVEFIGNVCQKLLYLILNFPYVLPLVVGHQKVVVLELFDGVNLCFYFHEALLD